MPQDSFEKLMDSHKNAFVWVKDFIKDIDFNKASPTFATIPLDRMGEDKVNYIRTLNFKMNMELEMVSTLHKEISAIIDVLGHLLKKSPDITIGNLLQAMQHHQDSSIALFVGNMPIEQPHARAADLLPQMIETRDSLGVAYNAIVAVYQINNINVHVLQGKRNEEDTEIAAASVKYIRKVKTFRTEIANKRKAAEQEIKDAQAKEESKEDSVEQDRKPTAEEFDEMQADSPCEPSLEPSLMPSSIPTGMPSVMSTEMSGSVYAASLFMLDESF